MKNSIIWREVKEHQIVEDRRTVKRGLTRDSGCKCRIQGPEPPVLALPVNCAVA